MLEEGCNVQRRRPGRRLWQRPGPGRGKGGARDERPLRRARRAGPMCCCSWSRTDRRMFCPPSVRTAAAAARSRKCSGVDRGPGKKVKGGWRMEVALGPGGGGGRCGSAHPPLSHPGYLQCLACHLALQALRGLFETPCWGHFQVSNPFNWKKNTCGFAGREKR